MPHCVVCFTEANAKFVKGRYYCETHIPKEMTTSTIGAKPHTIPVPPDDAI